jgi:hypothetical protein
MDDFLTDYRLNFSYHFVAGENLETIMGCNDEIFSRAGIRPEQDGAFSRISGHNILDFFQKFS